MDASINMDAPLGVPAPSNVLRASFQSSPAIWSLVAVFASIISYFSFASPKIQSSSSKAQRAKAMKQAFKAIESQTVSPDKRKINRVGDHR